MGLDFAWTKPNPPSSILPGHSFVCRYYSPDPSKNLTAAEAEIWSNLGVGIVTVWEAGATDMLGGYSAGKAAGAAAAIQARSAGQPPGSWIYYAADFDVQPSQFGACIEYLKGAAQLFPVGCYGPPALLQYLASQWSSGRGWQAGAWNPTGTVASNACIVQRTPQVTVGGAACDPNVAIVSDIGAWSLSSAPQPTVQAAAPVTGTAAAPEPNRTPAVRSVGATWSAAAKNPTGKGWWLLSDQGGVQNLGGAPWLGSPLSENKAPVPCLGIEAAPAGEGYWVYAADGSIWAFGTATIA